MRQPSGTAFSNPRDFVTPYSVLPSVSLQAEHHAARSPGRAVSSATPGHTPLPCGPNSERHHSSGAVQ